MRKALILAIAVFAGLWWLALGQPQTAPPALGPVSQPSPTGTPPPASPIPDQGSTEEGLQQGGFDPANPPAGAPTAASLEIAFTQATSYVQTINDYGFGDQDINDFITRARPFMTDSFYEEWHSIAQMSAESDADGRVWADYQRTQTRHAASTGIPVVTAWTGTELVLAVPYRTADVPVGGRVPQTGTERFARVSLVQTGNMWLIHQASSDF